eukprot:1264442-Prymnesium_polylepis.1
MRAGEDVTAISGCHAQSEDSMTSDCPRGFVLESRGVGSVSNHFVSYSTDDEAISLGRSALRRSPRFGALRHAKTRRLYTSDSAPDCESKAPSLACSVVCPIVPPSPNELTVPIDFRPAGI